MKRCHPHGKHGRVRPGRTFFQPQRRRALTLLELTVNLVVVGIVMGGLTSAMVLATRAIPDGNRPVDALIDGADVVNQIAGELHYAQSFSQRTATAVEFTVADRDADAAAETIRYAWSGTPGDPMTRQYNASAATPCATDVYAFDLAYDLRALSPTGSLVASVMVTLQVGPDPLASVETTVQILNSPEVP